MYRFIFFVIIVGLFNSCTVKNQSLETAKINSVIDEWHHAAAIADQDKFFDSFTSEGIYIGTDPSEHWTAKQLQEWSKSAFEKDTAWAFTPYNRHIYFADDNRTVWFDELLQTWMGTCRGSGVMQKQNGKWKIAHYHLAVAVPNDLIEDYIKMLPKE